METKKILYIFTSGRKIRLNKNKPKEFFYGFHSLKKKKFNVDLIELDELNKKSNYFSLTFLINKIRDTFFLKFFGIGFRTHQLVLIKDFLNSYNYIIGTNDSISLGLMEIKQNYNFNFKIIYFNMGLTNSLSKLKLRSNWKYKIITNYFKNRFKHFHKVLSTGNNEIILFRRIFKDYYSLFAYIGFCVDINFWKELNLNKKFFLFVGSEINRDFELALEIAIKNPLLKFVFVSNYEFKQHPSNLIIHKGSFKKPALSDQDLRKLYNQAHCVFLPIKKQTTLTSGQSVAMQAMSSGCPVVISDYQGLWDRNVLKNNNNIIISEHDEKNFSKILNKIQINKNILYIKKNARNLMEKKYSIDIFTNELIKYL